MLMSIALVLVLENSRAAEMAETGRTITRVIVSPSPDCKISPSGMPQAGCSDQDLCLLNPSVYQVACAAEARHRANRQVEEAEEKAIQSATRSTDPLFSVEDACDADTRTIGKGAAYVNVIPYKTKQKQFGPPNTPGYDIVGLGAREIEVQRCRFYFKKR